MTSPAEKLLMGHAHWTAERKRLKAEGCESMSKCVQLADGNKSCIAEIYHDWQSAEVNEWGEISITYDELWVEGIEEGRVCEHCQSVRELKRQRMNAGRRLGAVRTCDRLVRSQIFYSPKRLNFIEILQRRFYVIQRLCPSYYQRVTRYFYASIWSGRAPGRKVYGRQP